MAGPRDGEFISPVLGWLSPFNDNRIIDETVTSYKRRSDRRDSGVFQQRDKPKPQYAALNNCLVSVRFSRVIRMAGLSMDRGKARLLEMENHEKNWSNKETETARPEGERRGGYEAKRERERMGYQGGGTERSAINESTIVSHRLTADRAPTLSANEKLKMEMFNCPKTRCPLSTASFYIFRHFHDAAGVYVTHVRACAPLPIVRRLFITGWNVSSKPWIATYFPYL